MCFDNFPSEKGIPDVFLERPVLVTGMCDCAHCGECAGEVREGWLRGADHSPFDWLRRFMCLFVVSFCFVL